MTTELPTGVTEATDAPTAGLVLDNSYARALEGAYVAWKAAAAPAPRMVKLNRALAVELGLSIGVGHFAAFRRPQFPRPAYSAAGR